LVGFVLISCAYFTTAEVKTSQLYHEYKMLAAFASLRLSVGLRFHIIALLGILFCLTGCAGIILSIVDLVKGRPSFYNYDQSNGGLQVENPLWPSSGKS